MASFGQNLDLFLYRYVYRSLKLTNVPLEILNLLKKFIWKMIHSQIKQTELKDITYKSIGLEPLHESNKLLFQIIVKQSCYPFGIAIESSYFTDYRIRFYFEIHIKETGYQYKTAKWQKSNSIVWIKDIIINKWDKFKSFDVINLYWNIEVLDLGPFQKYEVYRP